MADSSTSTSSSETYLSDIITGAHGDKYQNDLALVLFERATRKGYDFKLGCEMAIADKFDDVAFFDKNTSKWTLIQTKHADTLKGKPSPLQFEMLFPRDESTREKGDFSLWKYFKSYVNVQEHIKERKNVIIFTNRDLEDFQHQSDQVVVVSRPVDEFSLFKLESDNAEPRQLGLEVSHDLRREMVDYVNQDFNSLKESIVELFKKGIVNQMIKHYRTPVASILTKTNHKVKFSENPSQDAFPMLESLKSHLDFKTAEVSLEKCKDLFTGKSRNRTWPIPTDLCTVNQFFNDLILLVAQPDDLGGTIDQDMRSWMRTWIRPDYFTRLEEPQLKMMVSLNDFFSKKQSPENANFGNSCEQFLELNDGKEFLITLKTSFTKQIRNLSNYNDDDASSYYVSRQLELSDKKMKMRDNDFVNELYDKFGKQPIHLLITKPGMGKSTILEHIAMAAQRKYTDVVFHFNLNTFNMNYGKVEETIPSDGHLLILETMLSKESFDVLRKNMQREIKNLKFFMVFDAFDELFPQNRKKVLEMFNHLIQNSNVKLLVSARKNVQTLLEDEFKVKPMNLVPFNIEDQTNFLEQFWDVSEENKGRFRQYVAYLFKMLHSASNRAIYKFSGLPLMLKMLAEIYEDDFKNFLTADRNDSEEPIPKQMFNVISLYEQFVRKSFDNKMIKKFGCRYHVYDNENNPLFDNFTLEHQLLAIKLLGISNLHIVFKDKKYREICKGFEERLKNGSEKSPLVEAFENHKEFVHISYAEFLVAKFLCCNIEIYEAEIFAEDSQAKLLMYYPMIRIFFFAMFEVQIDTGHLNILERHYNNNRNIAIWACEVHGLKTVEYLLSKKYDSTIINRLLHVAAEHNCSNICAYLFQNHRVVVDFKIDKQTPLHTASAKGHVQVVKMLLDNSADIEAKNTRRETPLHLAARMGRLEVAKMKIDNSANIEAKNDSDETPLHLAVQMDRLEVAKMLLDHSAEIEAKNNSDKAPLLLKMWAELYEDDFANYLIAERHSSKKFITNKMFNVIWLYEEFVRKGFDYKMVNKYGNAYSRYDEEFDCAYTNFALEHQLLAIKNVQINNLDNVFNDKHRQKIYFSFEERINKGFERSPLVKAFGNNVRFISLSYAEFLVAKFLFGNIEKYGKEIFAEASQAKLFNQYPMIRMFFFTMIEEQFKTKNLEILERHYKNNSNIALWSCEVHGLKTVEYLLRNIYDSTIINRLLHVAARHNYLNICAYLFKNHPVVVDLKIDGWTSLHIAAAKGYVEVVKMLIDKSANIEAKNDSDETALHLAASTGQLEVVKILLDNSANIEARNTCDETPLQLASQKGLTDIVKLLTDHLAATSAKNNDGFPTHDTALSDRPEDVNISVFMLWFMFSVPFYLHAYLSS